MFLKTARIILPFVVLLAPLRAQQQPPPAQLPELPPFYFDVLSFASDQPGLSRVDVYTDVPYEVLQFIKEGTVFRAQYEATITIFDSAGRQTGEKFWRDVVETNIFDETVSPKSGRLTQKTFLLAPGKYKVRIDIRDNETQKNAQLERNVDVRGYGKKPFMISDAMLVSRVTSEGEKKVVYPNISGNVGDLNDGFSVFFETYNSSPAESCLIILEIRDSKGTVVQSDTSSHGIREEKRSIIPWINSSKLFAGDYSLSVVAIPFTGSRTSLQRDLTAEETRQFTIRWRGVPFSIVDLDLAIDQLVYLVGKENIDRMKEGTAEEKREKFTEYWKRKDPTPGTERNELLEEYYSRVDYSNKNFGHYADGWRTDMGMVYIIFGPPNNIERHPFEIDSKPYEVWTYYELNREFVFIDQTGFGEYRLQTPIWDVWRTRPH